MSWFKRGDEALHALEQREKIAEMQRRKAVPKFWLEEGKEARVVFVDDTGFFCERHVIKKGGSFQEVTCCAELKPCPICIRENQRPMAITYYTIIDTREYVRRDGTVAKNTKVLLPAKRMLARQIWDYKQKYGSLVGAIVTLKRFTKKEANCGVITEIEKGANGKLKRVKLKGDYAVPFKYEEVLAPPTDDEWKLLGYSMGVIGESDDSSLDELDADKDDDFIDERLYENEEDDEDIPDDVDDVLSGIDSEVSETTDEEETPEDVPF